MSIATLKRRLDAIAQRLTMPTEDITIILQWDSGEGWDGRGEAPLLAIQPGMLAALEPDANADGTPTPTMPDAPDAGADDAPSTPDPTPTPVYVERRLFPHEQAQRRTRPRWGVR